MSALTVEAAHALLSREAQLLEKKAAAIAANPEIANITKEIQMERGKKVFLSACFACHMQDGKGLPGAKLLEDAKALIAKQVAAQR